MNRNQFAEKNLEAVLKEEDVARHYQEADAKGKERIRKIAEHHLRK